MDKKGLRRQMREITAVDPQVQHKVRRGLFEWLSPRLPGTIAAFLSMEGEIDLRPLMDQLPGWRWVLPRVEVDRSMTFRDAGAPLEVHPFGMEQPSVTAPEVPVMEMDVILVPGLAYDLRGNRLGNGAGYYDRVLAEARADAVTVGITLEARIVEAVPIESHDMAVRWLATEEGVRESLPNR